MSTAYRQPPQLGAIRTCTIGGVRTPALLGVAFIPLLFAFLLFSTRDSYLSCVRDGNGPGGGHCYTSRETYGLDEIVGMDLETQAQAAARASRKDGDESDSTARSTNDDHLTRLVLVTRTHRVPLERGYSYYAWDSRPEAVHDFDMFLHKPSEARYPRALTNLKSDLGVGVLVLIAAAIGGLSLRRRGMARLDIDDQKGTLLIVRDLTPKTAFKMVRTTHSLSLAPLPTPTIEQEPDGRAFLVLRQGDTSTPLVEVPENTVTRSHLMRKLTAFLADPAANVL